MICDSGIGGSSAMVSDDYYVINLFAIDDCELAVDVPNILNYDEPFEPNVDAFEPNVVGVEPSLGVATDCSSTDAEDENDSASSDYESDDLEFIANQRRVNITDQLLDYKELDNSMTFKDINEVRKCPKLYALTNKKESQLEKDGNCPEVRIKTLNIEHNCFIAYDNSRVDYYTIAHYFKKKLQNNPKYKVKDMRADLKAAFELNASHGKCKRAKNLILNKLDGSFKDDYNRLEAYGNELRISNLGSDIIINLSKDALMEGKRRFCRMYICLHALKMGFKEGLRPFIGLDGTFLKGKAKGQLLVAVALDSNNHFYHIAWAVVDKETKKTWDWFLGLLKMSLELNMGEGYTIISDMQKGLLEAMKIVLPEANHRFCVRHIEANWMKRWRSGEMKKLLWWSAWSTYEEEFDDQLRKLGEMDEDAIKDLIHYPPQCWCRAFFYTVCKNMAVDHNFTELFNAWILDARYKPIITMLEDIRLKVMNMLREHDERARAWARKLDPLCMMLYADYLRIAHSCVLHFNGDFGYEVIEGSDRHTVNLEAKQCTCRTWQLSGIPCPHAIKALMYNRIDPFTEIHWWYSKEATLKTYSYKLQPVRGEKF
ncbi:uncharacterized protein LOC132054104 [Lycium ferocissimum]|uniref:uncharacterized protein LOC132054104 n=1 Tax=Lycium ferocissimum TaxID=112874 RepID=UPI0028163395|nr:uncharacterized protein LOC132054104 [Lycium ferocissimum]